MVYDIRKMHQTDAVMVYNSRKSHVELFYYSCGTKIIAFLFKWKRL